MATFLFWDSCSTWAWASISASSLTCKHLIFRIAIHFECNILTCKHFVLQFYRKIWPIHIIWFQHMILDWAFRLNAEFFNENKFSLFRIWANQNSAISWFCLPVVRQECILVRVQIHKHWMILVLVRQQLLGQQRQLQLVVRQERRLRLAERLKLRRFTLR